MCLHVLYALELRYSCSYYNLMVRERQNLSAEVTIFIRLTHLEKYRHALLFSHSSGQAKGVFWVNYTTAQNLPKRQCSKGYLLIPLSKEQLWHFENLLVHYKQVVHYNFCSALTDTF